MSSDVLSQKLTTDFRAVLTKAFSVASLLYACLLAFPANAASISATLIPKIGSDANSDVSSTNTYTHAFDLATNSSLVLNGVSFTPTGAGGTSVFPWIVTDGNYGGTLTQTIDGDSTGLATLSNGTIQADGTLSQIVDTFSYQQTQSVGGSRAFELGGLTVGTRYRTNFYGFDWDNALDVRNVVISSKDVFGTARERIDWADPTGTGTPTDHQAFFVSVDFVATADKHSISMSYPSATDSAHIGAITNYVLEENVILQGDANLNDVVNQSDFAILQTNMLASGVGFAGGDLNGDGFVSMADFRLYKDSPHRVDGYDSLESQVAAAVPEPTACLLMIGAWVISLSRRTLTRR